MPDAGPSDLEWVPCPLCGSTGDPQRTPVVHTSTGANGQPAGFHIIRCESCGLHYTNPRPMLATLGRYYGDDYSPYQSVAADPAGAEGSIRSLVLRDAFGAPPLRPTGWRRTLARTIATVRKPEWFGFGVAWRGRGRLLDVGCSAGKLLLRMKNLGWDVTGLDFSVTAVAAVKALGIPALEGTLPHPQLAPGSFDVIAMRHVLEHVPDPRADVRHAWNLLAPGGLLLIQVPNFNAWEIGRLGDAALGLDLPRHFTHFTPDTLRAMLEREGMSGIEIRQVSHANWIRKAARRSDSAAAKILRRSLACRLAATWAKLTRRGNEIIATATKS